MGESITSNQQDPSTTRSRERANEDPEPAATSGAAVHGDHADWRAGPGVHRFAVFLSHNSRDKPTVERLAEKLREAALEPWLDRWYLTGGGVWQEIWPQSCAPRPLVPSSSARTGSEIGFAKS